MSTRCYHPFRERDIYASSMGSEPDVSRAASEETEEHVPTRRLDPPRALMGHDPDRAERDRTMW